MPGPLWPPHASLPCLLRAAALLLGVCLLALPGCTRGGTSIKVPRLLTPQATLDLGQGMPGETLTAALTLKNTGGNPLRIERVEAGCACSSLHLASPVVAPGEETSLEVSARLRPGQPSLSFPVQITSNDPASPVTVCLVRAALGPAALRADPAAVSFGEVATGTAPTRRVRILDAEGHTWPAGRPLTVEVGDGLVQAQTVSVKGSGGSAMALEVRLRSNLPLGPFHDALTLRPANGRSSIVVPIEGRVVPLLLVSPTSLYFGDIAPTAGLLRRYVMVRRTDGKVPGSVLKHTAPLPIEIAEVHGKLPSGSRATLCLGMTIDSRKVHRDVPHGELRLWLDGEPEPLVVGLMIFQKRKTRPAER